GRLPSRMHMCQRTVADVPMLVAGTGYTGEDGVELLLAPDGAPAVWDALVAAGVTPVGLGARDTLRLEVCFHLYGNDMDEHRNPIEAGLGWVCKEDTGFIGAEAVRAARADAPPEKLVAFALTGEGIPRPGNPVVGGGVVTSGTLSPCLGAGIGMAYLPAERAQPGEPIEIDVRGRIRPAEVREKPLYKKETP
ncbi:MAG: glycine cleavage system protein T, partial [Actinomycetota bacterium]|nr:glycine cleavage system protein T [Actinomycetota bacterium]